MKISQFFIILIFVWSQLARANPLAALLITMNPSQQPSAFIWTGKSGDGNFNTAGNWWGLAVPGSGNTAIFDYHYCGSHCDVSINANVNVQGIRINEFYPGTITQQTTRTITIGSGGWSQSSGVFLGGDSAINISGSLNLLKGSFTSTSGVLTLNNVSASMNILTITSSATFNHNSGTLQFAGGLDYSTSTNNLILASPLNLNHLVFAGSVGHASNIHHSITQTINVAGNLTFSSTNVDNTIDTGTISVAGNINAGTGARGGTGTILVSGNSAQTYTGDSSYYLPNLTIQTTGSFSPNGSTSLGCATLNVAQGTFTAAPNTLHLRPTSSTTYLTIAAGATFNHNSGTLVVFPEKDYSDVYLLVSTSGPLNLNNLTFSGNAGHVANYFHTFNQPVNVAGTLVYSATNSYNVLSSGTINLAGNLNAGAGAMGGDGSLIINGNAAQTYTGLNTSYLPNLTVNTTGSFAPGGATSLGVQSLNLQNGTFTAPSNELVIHPTGALVEIATAAGATFNHNNGTLVFYPTGDYSDYTLTTNLSAALSLNHVRFSGTGGHGSNFRHSFNQNLNVAGNLDFSTISASHVLNSGTLNVAGNVTATSGAGGGAASITMNGASQTINVSAGNTLPTGNFTVSSSGTLTLASNVTLNGATQSFNVTSGAVDQAGFNLTLHALSLGGRTLTKNAGVLTVNGTVVATGSLYGGTINP